MPVAEVTWSPAREMLAFPRRHIDAGTPAQHALVGVLDNGRASPGPPARRNRDATATIRSKIQWQADPSRLYRGQTER